MASAVPRTDRGYHPLCAEAVRTRVIEPEDVERFGPAPRLLAVVSTPAEFDELEALLGHKL
jgi:hypothetical protein